MGVLSFLFMAQCFNERDYFPAVTGRRDVTVGRFGLRMNCGHWKQQGGWGGNNRSGFLHLVSTVSRQDAVTSVNSVTQTLHILFKLCCEKFHKTEESLMHHFLLRYRDIYSSVLAGKVKEPLIPFKVDLFFQVYQILYPHLLKYP